MQNFTRTSSSSGVASNSISTNEGKKWESNNSAYPELPDHIYVQVQDQTRPLSGRLANTDSSNNGGIKWESNPAYDLTNKPPPATFKVSSGILEENKDDVKSYDFSVQKVKEWQENNATEICETNPIYDSLSDSEMQANKNTVSIF